MLAAEQMRMKGELNSLKEGNNDPLELSLRILRHKQTLVGPLNHKNSGLKITAGQRTMSGLIEGLTGQTFDLPVMLTGQN